MCREFGVSEDDGLVALRCADSIMPTDRDVQEVQELSFYRKYNRLKDGSVSVGDAFVCTGYNTTLYTLDHAPVSLATLLLTNPVTVILASSIS